MAIPAPFCASGPDDAVLVIGGGIVGLAQAYALCRRGHAVRLFESGPDFAGRASHANGGHLSTDSGAPWVSPSILPELVHWLFDRHRPLSVKPVAMGLAGWSWLLAARRHLGFDCYLESRRRLHALTDFSVTAWQRIETELEAPLAPGRGVLYLYRNLREWNQAHRLLERERMIGVQAVPVLAEEAPAYVPELTASKIRPAGGIWYPGDRFGDCREAAHRLAGWVESHGGLLHRDTPVRAVETIGGRVRIRTDHGLYTGVAVVIAAGVDSPALTRPLGIPLRLCPVKGYTRTYAGSPLASSGPALADHSRKVVLTPLDRVLRVAGMAEFAGLDDRPVPRYFTRLHETATDWLPGLAQIPSTLDWACLRAMTADGLPLLGATRRPGVFLNTGHGPLGWTLAAGTAELVADAIEGKGPVPGRTSASAAPA
jgi:D-amino-acid dehydrogenase